MSFARVVGVGKFVPQRVVTNERIARAVPGWTPERIAEKTGIVERRFLWDFDAETGQAIPPPEGEALYPISNTDMCEVALKQALGWGGLRGDDLDALFVVTCTPDQLNFSADAMALHRRVGMRRDAFGFVVDDGCGGTPYVIDLARRLIESGAMRTVAVVASAFTSPLVNREAYTDEVVPAPGAKPLSGFLSMYVFGDAAGAIVLRADGPGHSRILNSFSGNGYDELVLRRGGGADKHMHQGRARPGDLAFVVNGPLVAKSYPAFMDACLQEVFVGTDYCRDDVQRFYFHQPNKRVLDHFIDRTGLDPAKVPINVHRYGNTSAAGMLVLLAEDLESGAVELGSGALAVIAAVGANVHYGAQLIAL